jgi:cell division protein FtsB
METNQENTGKKKVMMGVIIALLLIVSVTVYFTFSGKQDLMASNAEKSALDSSFRSLSDTLDARNADIDRFKSNNVKLDSTITARQQIIDTEKKQLAGLMHNEKMTLKELDAANTLMASYKSSIVDLQKQVADLCAQNQQLTEENEVLITDLNTEKKAKAQLAEQNRNLTGKVLLSSLLQLDKVEVEGIKKRENGKDVVVHNFKAVESLRVAFETGLNKNLSPGALALYVKITNPKGETIYLPNQGSGSIQLAANNTSMQYTREADIDWNQTSKKVIVYWTQNIQTAGVYKVEIYQSGYQIGKGEVKLN